MGLGCNLWIISLLNVRNKILFIFSKDSGSSLKPEDVKLKSAIFSEKTSNDEQPEGIGAGSSPVKPPSPSDPLEELRWGENMVLVGDTFWRSFHR